MVEHEGRPTDRELEELHDIVFKTIKELIIIADKYNIDRDDLITFFSTLLWRMRELSSFKYMEINNDKRSTKKSSQEIQRKSQTPDN